MGLRNGPDHVASALWACSHPIGMKVWYMKVWRLQVLCWTTSVPAENPWAVQRSGLLVRYDDCKLCDYDQHVHERYVRAVPVVAYTAISLLCALLLLTFSYNMGMGNTMEPNLVRITDIKYSIYTQYVQSEQQKIWRPSTGRLASLTNMAALWDCLKRLARFL